MAIKTNIGAIEKYFKHEHSTSFREHFEKNFHKWCYDLCLGEEVYITSETSPRILSECEPFVNIRPGEFALLITYETLELPPEVMAFISVKFTYKRKGLINISGFHVDPHYEGKIIFSVYNAGPSDILLKYKDPVFMVFFQDIEPLPDNKKPEKYYGFKHIPPSLISEIRGQSTTLADNRHKIDKLEQTIKIYGTIAITIIATLLGVILTEMLG